MLDRKNHEIVLKKILRDMCKDPSLAASLGFKGGTCLYFFYGLDRFSTDLDFNLIGDDFSPDVVTTILERHLTLDNVKQSKYHTWFWIGTFERGKQKIKVEISKRKYPDAYIISDFYGLSIKTMAPDSMLAHKLCAITDRPALQNRDLYDAYFMLKKNYEINEEILRIRTRMSLADYFGHLADFVKKRADPRHILHGMGDLLDAEQKKWTKQHLIDDLVFELKIRSE